MNCSKKIKIHCIPLERLVLKAYLIFHMYFLKHWDNIELSISCYKFQSLCSNKFEILSIFQDVCIYAFSQLFLEMENILLLCFESMREYLCAQF